MDNNNITLPIKNTKEGLPTPPLLDRAVNQLRLTTMLIIIGTITP